MIQHDPHAIDDFDNPLLKHVAIFKLFLDKIHNSSDSGVLPNNKTAFVNERDSKSDDLLSKLTDMKQEDMETVLKLEKKLKERATYFAKEVSFNFENIERI